MVENAYGDKKMLYSQVNSLLKAVKDEKMTKNTKKTTDVVVSDVMVTNAAAVYKAHRRNRQHSSHHKGPGYVPADFQSKKTLERRVAVMG
jgi:hypothetical protein